MKILTLNAGSSSVKYALFAGEKRILSGNLERVNDYESTLKEILAQMGDWSDLVGVGHRVVHGGTRYFDSLIVTPDTLPHLHELDPLAPLHNPHNLAGIETMQRLLPGVPQIAVFDTGFFQSLPEHVTTFALPHAWKAQYGIRRYGFHGISYRYVTRRAAELLGNDRPNLIVFHIGNGASAAAICDGRPIDTSLGLSALPGLVMGTRPGDLDVGVVFHLLRAGWSWEEIEDALYRQSGLKGITEGLSDRRDVHRAAAEGHPLARLAEQIEIHRLRHYLGAFWQQLDPLHGVVFTAGVGENDPLIRAGVLRGHERWGLELDDTLNQQTGDAFAITSPASRIQAWVIATDEEQVMWQDVSRLVSGAP